MATDVMATDGCGRALHVMADDHVLYGDPQTGMHDSDDSHLPWTSAQPSIAKAQRHGSK